MPARASRKGKARHRVRRNRLAFFVVGCLLVSFLAWVVAGLFRKDPAPPGRRDVRKYLSRSMDLTIPARGLPSRFPARTHLPNAREEAVSGLPPTDFDPERDLTRVDDARVWWESDYDRGDKEEDRVMHRAMEESFRRLIELVSRSGGRLKVQDAYRDEGIHANKSLHKEGRAVDLTCDELGLEQLGKLAWAAGFDWVYHEYPRKGGAHIHASVRADRPIFGPFEVAARGIPPVIP